jgi:N-acyl homoserine lactone hydrolase
MNARLFNFTLAFVAGVLLYGTTLAQSNSNNNNDESGVDRLYVFDCGLGHAIDQSRWTAGSNIGKPVDITVNCYLIHHKQGYFLWDTGIADFVASQPNGWQAGNTETGLHWTRAKTLASQLAAIHVAPSDIRYIGISHTHPDHIGNAELFPNTPIMIQRAEYQYYFNVDGPPGFFLGAKNPGIQVPPGDPVLSLSKNHPVIFVDEDRDVFGDGSIVILSTPGHTPGHQSLLVHLPKTGWVILSGDAVHFQSNWDNDRIPYFATMPTEQKFQTLLSMQRLRNLMSFYHAQLWIGHDKTSSDKVKKSPESYE